MWTPEALVRHRIRKTIAAIIYHKRHRTIQVTAKKKNSRWKAKAKGNTRPFNQRFPLQLYFDALHLSNVSLHAFGLLQSTAGNTTRATFESTRLPSVCHNYWSSSIARLKHGSGCVHTNRRSEEIHFCEGINELSLLQWSEYIWHILRLTRDTFSSTNCRWLDIVSRNSFESCDIIEKINIDRNPILWKPITFQLVFKWCSCFSVWFGSISCLISTWHQRCCLTKSSPFR